MCEGNNGSRKGAETQSQENDPILLSASAAQRENTFELSRGDAKTQSQEATLVSPLRVSAAQRENKPEPSRKDAKTWRQKVTEMTENEIGTIVIDAALEVHRQLGPGLLETVYEIVLAHELEERGLVAVRQVPITVTYKGLVFDGAFRADLIVDQKVIIELKSVEKISRAHRKQLQTYLRLADLRLGYLLNFGAPLMKEGIVRAVNRLEESRSPLRVSAPPREHESSHRAEPQRRRETPG